MPGVSASGSQITVVGSRAFVGSRNGIVYALDTKTGCLAWAFEADAGVRSTPVVGRGADGDAHGVFRRRERASLCAGCRNGRAAVEGQGRGTPRRDDHWRGGVAQRTAVICRSRRWRRGRRRFRPTSAARSAAASWRSMPAAEADLEDVHDSPGAAAYGQDARGTQLWGPSGAAVWSQPVIDADRNRIYIATGDNYSNPPARERRDHGAGHGHRTRSVGAADVGRRLVERRPVSRPARARELPGEGGPDYDFGSSPVPRCLTRWQKDHRRRSEIRELHGLNPDTGQQLWKTQVGEGGILGGIEWGFAVDATTAYVSLSHALEKKPGEAGGLVAVNLADGKPRWTVPPTPDPCKARPGCNTGQPAAVSSIPGVVFSGSLDGHLRAYDSA